MAENDHTISEPGGRRLHVRESGPADGHPVLVHHGTPGSGLVRRRWVRAAEELGVRLISYDRPGYGGSDRHEGRTVADAAADAVAIADGLGLERVTTLGSSGGGPHALACGALAGDLVPAVAVFASAAPADAADLDFTGGMGENNLEEFAAARQGPEALAPLLERFAGEMLATDTKDLIESLRSLLSPPDVEVLSTELGEDLVNSLRTGISRRRDGWLDDDLALLATWGFAPESISVPVQLWQGRLDLMVPPAHGEWLAGRLTNADIHLCDDEGHLSIGQTRIDETLAWLVERGTLP